MAYWKSKTASNSSEQIPFTLIKTKQIHILIWKTFFVLTPVVKIIISSDEINDVVITLLWQFFFKSEIQDERKIWVLEINEKHTKNKTIIDFLPGSCAILK